jgi:hypothetical protein
MENMLYFSDNNPGGRKVVNLLYSKYVMTEEMVRMMKKMNLRGSLLWSFYKNVCNMNIKITIELLKDFL